MTTEDSRTSTAPFEPLPPPGGLPYYLYVPGFQAALDTALKNNAVIGYVAQLHQHGAALFTNTWQYARRPQENPNGSELWTQDVPMHLASVSKLITAMAMMVLFLDHKLDKGPGRRGPIIQRIHPWEEAAISTYLPDYWQTGPNIENITFLDLLQHTSGLSTPTGPVTFQSIQSAIATGSNGLGTYNYQNVNYALCRILLPVINGDIDQGADQSIWDSKTQTAYATYVQDKVFAPSNVGGATLVPQPNFALAYGGDPTDMALGWDSGGSNLAQSCGCDGWHLSVNQLLVVMGEFRRGGGILPSVDAQAMLDLGIGVDPLTTNSAPLPAALSTPAGNVYCKPGDWHNNGQDLQTLAYFLPEDMELVVFVNSTVNGLNAGQNPTNSFRTLVTKAYLDNLTTQLPINE